MSEKKVYTNAEINAALSAALEEKGHDYVYERGQHGSCNYAVDGKPSCIVGYVLNTLDPEMFKEVAEFEDDYDRNRGDNSFYNVVTNLNLPFHEDQRRALGRVQQDQDTGATWGSAVYDQWVNALGEKI